MKLVPLIFLLSSYAMALKIKKIKRLLVTIGGIASVVRNGGIGKSLQIATQQTASKGVQYAADASTLYTPVQPANNIFLISTGTSPGVFSTTNGLAVSTNTINAIESNTLPLPSVISQHTTIHRKIAVPIPAPYAVPVPKDVIVPVETPVVVPVDKPYSVQVPVLKALAVDQPVSVLAPTTFLAQKTIVQHGTLPVAQAPLVQAGIPYW